MTKIATLVLGLAMLTAATACSIKKEEVKDSYDLTENSCPTGKHEFSGESSEDVQRQLCAALQSDSANNGCAAYSRAQYFKEKCPGVFAESAVVDATLAQ
jgi:hypothetical protein